MKMRSGPLCGLLALQISSVLAQSPDWNSSFGKSGPSNPANGAVVYDGNLYVFGEFDEIVTDAPSTVLSNCNSIVAWNGLAWSTVGGGLTTSSMSSDPGDAKHAAVFDGYLFVGGEFGGAGGTATSGLAKWDGSAWSSVSLPSGFTVVDRIGVVEDSGGDSIWISARTSTSTQASTVYSTESSSPTSLSWTLRASLSSSVATMIKHVPDYEGNYVYVGLTDGTSFTGNGLTGGVAGLARMDLSTDTWHRMTESNEDTCTVRFVLGPNFTATDALVHDGTLLVGSHYTAEAFGCYGVDDPADFSGGLDTWSESGGRNWNRAYNILSYGDPRTNQICTYSECESEIVCMGGSFIVPLVDTFSFLYIDSSGLLEVPPSGGSDGIANAVVEYDGWIYVIGSLTIAGPNEVVGVARWGCGLDCIPADVNHDGLLDILDYLDFIDAFATCENEPAPCTHNGIDPNFNGDEIIDILDFLDFVDRFSLCTE